jgi:hypothetical protein
VLHALMIHRLLPTGQKVEEQHRREETAEVKVRPANPLHHGG